MSDCTSSKTDSYIVIIVRELELKFDATQVEIDDTRFLSCLPVAPFAMEATFLKVSISFYRVLMVSIVSTLVGVGIGTRKSIPGSSPAPI